MRLISNWDRPRVSAYRFICVGTHHKTGTFWVRRAFNTIAKEFGIPTQLVYPNFPEERLPQAERAILFEWNSAFPRYLFDRNDARFFHMIRDPRDVLLSGESYHKKASAKVEKELHQPREDLNGKTYQEYLNALPNRSERLFFEMEEIHARTLKEMRAWNYDAENTIEIRFEEAMQDHDCDGIYGALQFLGFSDSEAERGREIFWEHSLFGGLKDEKSRGPRYKVHVTSGAITRWRSELSKEVGEIYAERYGRDLVALGYETDNGWVDALSKPISSDA